MSLVIEAVEYGLIHRENNFNSPEYCAFFGLPIMDLSTVEAEQNRTGDTHSSEDQVNNDTVLDQGYDETEGATHGRIALAKAFSVLVLLLAGMFFGVFCFASEQMSVATPFGVPLSIVSVPGLILAAIAISGAFVYFARANDRACERNGRTGARA